MFPASGLGHPIPRPRSVAVRFNVGSLGRKRSRLLPRTVEGGGCQIFDIQLRSNVSFLFSCSGRPQPLSHSQTRNTKHGGVDEGHSTTPQLFPRRAQCLGCVFIEVAQTMAAIQAPTPAMMDSTDSSALPSPLFPRLHLIGRLTNQRLLAFASSRSSSVRLQNTTTAGSNPRTPSSFLLGFSSICGSSGTDWASPDRKRQ